MRIVGTDHDDNSLGAIAVQFPVHGAPQKISRIVARISAVQHAVAVRERRIRGSAVFRLRPLHEVRNRITHEDNIDLAAGRHDLPPVAQKALRPPIRSPRRGIGIEPPHGNGGNRNIPPAVGNRLQRRGESRTGRPLSGTGAVQILENFAAPHIVSERTGMKQIWHHFTRKRPVHQKELLGEIHPNRASPVRIAEYLAVHNLVPYAKRVVRPGSARKDRQKKQTGLRLLCADLADNLANSQYRVRRRLFRLREMSCIVGSYHQDDSLGLVTVKLAVLYAPQHMFSTVRRISEVQRLERRPLEILVPLSAAPALPTMRYRVTDKNHLAAASLDKSTLLLEALAPPMIRIG